MDFPRSRFLVYPPFATICYTYGRAVMLTARQWEKFELRIVDNYCKLSFLHYCLRNHVVPPSLKRKPAVESAECYRAVLRFQRQTMRSIINDLHRRTRKLKELTATIRSRCQSDLESQHFLLLDTYVRQKASRIKQQTTFKLDNRAKRLRSAVGNPPPSTLIHNLSSRPLTSTETSLLQRDAGFNINDASNLDFVAALEPALQHVNIRSEVRDSVRLQLVSSLMSHRRHHPLTRAEYKAAECLRRDTSIVVLPADKGRATVIMDRVQYNDKALELLGDTTSYRVVSHNPMVSLRNRINKLLDNLKRKGRLGNDTLRRLRPKDVAIARFYGLPKIHKQGVPLRPIVSFRGTPTSALAKWLCHRLDYLVQDGETMVRSAEDFLSKIRGMRVEEDETMVSFDVVSLFTSIPQDLAVNTIRDLLHRKFPDNSQDNLRPEDLVDLLKVSLTVYFTFQGVTYEQIKGTPMGSPISSVIAEAVLQQVEHVAMTQLRPKFWARYVDDTFVVIKKSHLANFVGILNSVCADIQFTVEEERQGKLAFLDVLVHRQIDGTLHTKVFRKPTHTDRILHFDSNHPMSHKIGCIRSLFGRISSHCSTTPAKAEEERHLFRIFQRNGYPIGFIRKHRTPRRPLYGPDSTAHNPTTIRIALPYVKNISEATARTLAPYGIKIAHKPTHTLRSRIMKPKDPLPTQDKSNVIYKIPCGECPAQYIGETSKCVSSRIQEHRLAIKRGEPHSQLWTHMMGTGHSFNFDGAEVVAADNTKSGRLLKEAWFSGDTSINRHIELCQAHVALRAWGRQRQQTHMAPGISERHPQQRSHRYSFAGDPQHLQPDGTHSNNTHRHSAGPNEDTASMHPPNIAQEHADTRIGISCNILSHTHDKDDLPLKDETEGFVPFTIQKDKRIMTRAHTRRMIDEECLKNYCSPLTRRTTKVRRNIGAKERSSFPPPIPLTVMRTEAMTNGTSTFNTSSPTAACNSLLSPFPPTSRPPSPSAHSNAAAPPGGSNITSPVIYTGMCAPSGTIPSKVCISNNVPVRPCTTTSCEGPASRTRSKTSKNPGVDLNQAISMISTTTKTSQQRPVTRAFLRMRKEMHLSPSLPADYHP